MTREEAIKVLDEWTATGTIGENCWVHFEADLDDVDNALDMAISALREQEELARNLHDVTTACEWCFHFANDRQYLVSHGNGMYEEAMFEFCPMCGRRLEDT